MLPIILQCCNIPASIEVNKNLGTKWIDIAVTIYVNQIILTKRFQGV